MTPELLEIIKRAKEVADSENWQDYDALTNIVNDLAEIEIPE